METILDFLAEHAEEKSENKAFTFIEDDGSENTITFSDLYGEIICIGEFIKSLSEPGNLIVLLFPPGLEYIKSFLACLYAGTIAVPLYPPKSINHAGRVLRVIKDCGPKFALTSDQLKQELLSELKPLSVYGFNDCRSKGTNRVENEARIASLAFLQYTSGSTGDPKGVMISHSNILENLYALRAAAGVTSRDLFCNWLPLFHDLGLINTLLLPILLGAHSVLMSPARFIRRPICWFRAISEYRATTCGAPNFAFDYCVERIKSQQLTDIDLSSWRIAFNAAEPIDAESFDRFYDKFASVGFNRTAFYPAYGMAEATVFISAGDSSTPVLTNSFDADAISDGQVVLASDDSKTQTLVSCGRPQAKHIIKIVDHSTLQELPEDVIGEIWFAGPSVAQGYWGAQEKTRETFAARLPNDKKDYLRTGDLGFIHAGNLYISGRIKDVLIIRGRNYYPQDFEKLAYDAHSGLQKGGGAVFEVRGKAVLVQEIQNKALKAFNYQAACKCILAAIFDYYDVLLDDIVFLKTRRLNKTSSGKVQRALTKSRYLSGDLEILQSLKGFSEQHGVQFFAPATALEEELCGIWQEVMGVESIGVQDNFFALGGHSLLASRVLSQVRSQCNCDLSIRDLFEHQTIQELAKLVTTKRKESVPEIIRFDTQKELPLSYMQQSLWLTDQIDSVGSQYNVAKVFSLDGEVDISALTTAFSTIIDRHDVFRYVYFSDRYGTPKIRIKENFAFSISIVDGFDNLKEDNQRAVEDYINVEISRAFDLTKDLLPRVSVLKDDSSMNLLVIVMHHLVCDGWSEGIFIRELSACYKALTEKTPIPLQPLEYQYVDFTFWQNTWLEGSAREEQLEFWRGKLHGMPDNHNLPLDRSRPAQQSHVGASVWQVLDQNLVEALIELAKSHESTLFIVLHAAFSVLLSRLSGDTDLVVGAAVANREQVETQQLIGLFANTIILRSDLSNNPSFLTLLGLSKQYLVDAYAHQQLPFEVLVDELTEERDLSRSPLFQIKLALHNNDVPELLLSDVKATEIELRSIYTKHDLSLDIYQKENRLSLCWEYATDIFDNSSIKRMSAYFECILKAIVDQPSVKCSEISLMSHQAQKEIEKYWAGPKGDFSNRKCIHELFEKKAALLPDQIAIISGSEEITYSELNKKANQIAHYLLKQGIETEELVGLYIERSIESVVGLLGIVKAGAAYVPLDPDHPADRIAFVLKDAAIRIVLTERHLLQALPAEGVHVLPIDADMHDVFLSNCSSENIDKHELGLEPSNLAYVIYTSGSSGFPKGVLVEHRGLCNLVSWQERYFSVTAGSRISQVASYMFDGSVGETFMALTNGATLVLLDRHQTPGELLDTINQLSINVSVLVPSMLKEMDPTKIIDGDNLSIVAVGESCPVWLAQIWSRHCRFYNGYGPTECTVYSHIWEVQAGRPNELQQVPIGKPIDNIQAYVADNKLNPVPPGVVGEICLSGVGLARGYLNREELTAEKFVSNPFKTADEAAKTDIPEHRIYRTGDLAYMTSKGDTIFVGRVDQQVKIRGIRIETGEIEGALHRCCEVKDSVVTKDQAGQQLLAFVVPQNADNLLDWSNSKAEVEVRKYLKQVLPGHMLPAVYIAIESIPLNSNGKVDLHTLLKLNQTRNNRAVYVPPETEVQKRLCMLWEELLQQHKVGLEDKFFSLGGHSLLAVRLVAEVRDRFAVEITVRDVFDCQTVRELTEIITNADPVRLPNLVPLAADEHIPLSFAQQRLWLVDQIEPGGVQYNIPLVFELKGNLNFSALAIAFRTVVERHKVLRTTIEATSDGEPKLRLRESSELEIPLFDISSLSTEEQEESIEDHLSEQAERPFNLASDFMLRMRLIKRSECLHVLSLTMHHIASDAWSGGVLAEEFANLYETLANKKESKLPDLPIQYSDYAAWQRSYLRNEVLDELLDFWKQNLGGMPEVHNLPLDKARPAIQSYSGATYKQDLPSTLRNRIYELAHINDATLFMVLNAAFVVLLSRYSNENRVVIGTPVANREHAALSPIVGFFVNSLVLSADVTDNPSFEKLTLRCKKYLLGAYMHQQLPFERLVDELQPDRSLSYSPLFQIKLALQNVRAGKLDLPGLDIREVVRPNNFAKHDLSLDVFESESGFSLYWEYAKDIFDSRTIERMAAHFEVLLEKIIEYPKKPIKEIQILLDSEKKLLVKYSRAKAPASKSSKYIHQLFELHAELAPTSTAVVFDSEEISYQELNQVANQVAHYLLARGVTTDSLVGLYFERSIEMIIGILGVLKAGAAYLPIDPAYPESRVEYIFSDSEVKIVLTESHLLPTLSLEAMEVLPLDNDIRQALLNDYSIHNISPQQVGLKEQNLAYVIYTSGSTGKPKGVLVEHRNLIASTQSRYEIYQDTPSSFGLFSSYAFDSSVAGIFWTLTTGGKLCIADLKQGFDQNKIQAMFINQEISHFLVLPSIYSSMLQSNFSAPESVRAVIVAGEECDRTIVTQHFRSASWKNSRLYNEYGPTEACVWSSVHECNEVDEGMVPIGRPVPHAGLYVLDQQREFCPIGVVGELYVGGFGVARGYLNQPKLTATKFINNPFDTESTQRLYKTDDLVRWVLAEDEKSLVLDFVGRTDNQVKIRGFRVELGEIESCLAQHAAVMQSAVLVTGKPEKLVAYIGIGKMARELEQQKLTESLRIHIREALPDYMTPSFFVFLNELPLNANGKINRKALTKIKIPSQADSQYLAPVTETEKLLCSIWQEVLELDEIGVNDNFFNIGGDSILSIKVVALAKEKGLNFAVKDIFNAQTIRRLCETLKNNPQTKPEIAQVEPFGLVKEICDEELDKLRIAGLIEDAYPLSTLQQGMIYDNQVNPEKGTYHDIISFRLIQEWSEKCFRKALGSLMLQNEQLRSLVRFEGELPLHLIYVNLALPLEVNDLRTYEEREKENLLARWQQLEKLKPFVWDKPLWSVTIHRFTDDSFQFSLSCHHALLDGWSVATLITQLFEQYLQSLNGYDLSQYSPLPYRYFIARELTVLSSIEAKEYWQDTLEDAELPWWSGRPKRSSEYIEWTIEEKYLQSLGALSRKLRVPEKDIFLTAYMALLRVINGKPGITSSVVFNARPELQGGEKGVGLFLNTLPFSLNKKLTTWVDMIHLVSAQLTEMMEFRHYPLAKIQQESGLDFSGALFDYTNFHVYDEIRNELEVGQQYGFVETNYLFIFNCAKNSQSKNYHLSITLDDSIFGKGFISRAQSYFNRILVQLLEQPNSQINYSLLLEKERLRLLERWNHTAVEYPKEKCIQEVFELHVKETPNAIAVRYKERELSYTKLNREANKIAHYLIEQGVQPDMLVGLCVERSLESIIGLLGIIKAGGAYLPIDPGYPKSRIEFILEDSNIEMLLTESHLLSALPLSDQKILPMDMNLRDSILESYSDSDIDPSGIGITSESLAYVIYTSGSTGRPKGVLLEHKGVCNLANWQARYYGVNQKSKVSQFASFAFDGSVGETFMALLNGATSVMLDRRDSPRALLQSINSNCIDTVVMVPSLLKELDPSLLTNGDKLTVVAVGEVCPPKLAEEWSKYCTFCNGYGPTECTVYSHIWKVPEKQPELGDSVIPIGKPIDNIEGYILDVNLLPVPIGTVGELYLSGAGLARGYLNRPELTDERFIPNPFFKPTCSYSEEGSLHEYPIENVDSLAEQLDATSLKSIIQADALYEAESLGNREFLAIVEPYLDADLVEKTNKFISDYAGNKASIDCFKRYVVEGINDNYASIGIGKKVVTKLLPFEKYEGKTGIDFGFGNGEVLRVLIDMGASVTGLDINPIFVKKVREADWCAEMVKIDIDPELFIQQGGIVENSQDFVISTLTLDRMENPINLLKNMFSVLKFGGMFAIQTLLPVVGVEDGGIADPITYTPEDNKLTPGNDLEEDKQLILERLIKLGAANIRIYKIPYAVKSRDGIQEYSVWAFAGYKKRAEEQFPRVKKMYKTGDLALYRDDGNVQFIGRSDQQVKVRGFRIELGEIEACLTQHELVSEAVVVVQEEVQRLAAYIVPTKQKSNQESTDLTDLLRAHLKQTLADFMLPAVYISLPSMPLTPNGKIDRMALPSPGTVHTREYTGPDSEMEVALCKMWQKLLKMERVGVTDDFFELGGHSLLAVRLVSEIRSDMKVDIDVKTLFEKRTIRELAVTIKEAAEIQGLLLGDVELETLSEEQIDSYLEMLAEEAEV